MIQSLLTADQARGDQVMRATAVWQTKYGNGVRAAEPARCMHWLVACGCAPRRPGFTAGV